MTTCDEVRDRGDRWNRVAMLLLPAVAAGIVYVNTLGADFVHDDNDQIVENPWVHELRYLPELLTRPVWAYRTVEPTNYYRPVQMGLYNLLWAAGGGDPMPFHLASLLLHTLTTAGVAALVHRLSRDRLFAGLAALIFAVHPVNTETVAWVACVPEVTYALFGITTLALHASSWRSARPWAAPRRWLALLAFLLALLSKETGVVVVGLVFLLEFWVRPREGPGESAGIPGRPALVGAMIAVAPYLVTLGLYLVVRRLAVGGLAPVMDSQVSTRDALIGLPVLFGSYLRVMILPVNLLAHHVFEPPSSLADPAFIAGLVAIVGIPVALILLARRRSDLALAGAIVCLPFVPVLYLPALHSTAFAERYAYLPSAGFAWLFVAGALGIARAVWSRRVGRRVAVVVVAAVVVVFGAMTVRRNGDWRNGERLAAATLRVEPRAKHMYTVLAHWHLKHDRVEEALRVIEQGVAAVPGDVLLEANLINLRLRLGRIGPDEALVEYGRLRMDQPRIYELHAFLGDAYGLAGRFEEAEDSFRRAIELNPNDPLMHNRLAFILAQTGRLDEARAALLEALKIDPDFPTARQNLENLDRMIRERASP